MHVLISGAGIAGPVLAFWLSQYGIKSTIVERSPLLRTNGQTIDLRGSSIKVAKLMGLEEIIRNRSTHEDGIYFVDADDKHQAAFPMDTLDGRGFTSEIEIVRGELVDILFEATSKDPNIQYKFDDYITDISSGEDSALVTFNSGNKDTYDIVVGADGLGSKTRRIVFGEQDSPYCSLGQYGSYFTIPHLESDGTWSRWYNAPGGRVLMLRPDGQELTTRAYLFYISEHEKSDLVKKDAATQKATLTEYFEDAGWEAPRILKGMQDAKDFYFQEIAQVKTEQWSKGRFVLLGDAGYCPSPISGLGTTCAVVGAYVLAGEIATKRDYKSAFEGYETILRPYIEKAQKLPPGAPRLACPQTEWGIWALNKFFGAVSFVLRSGVAGWFSRFAPAALNASTDLELPNYEISQQ
ncbi:hypothetical protein AKO1_015204 [Acrasis kona]|uniref:FAD-binding domain-containing protein n=1 Tax=Acrasis kona TaxID=1008807 RepID=A0AAW2ZEU8_9EUKA